MFRLRIKYARGTNVFQNRLIWYQQIEFTVENATTTVYDMHEWNVCNKIKSLSFMWNAIAYCYINIWHSFRVNHVQNIHGYNSTSWLIILMSEMNYDIIIYVQVDKIWTLFFFRTEVHLYFTNNIERQLKYNSNENNMAIIQ